ncbi:hypothetical protein ACLEVB_17220 [Enterobacter ludwigii]|uniref:hypothetical protein n=1 Tax=Enterobacter ludwigii TaxID=299767 RepID=UPI00397522E5
MTLIELKHLIAKKLGIALSCIGAEDFKAYGVRFQYLGSSYRATTDLTVEKVDGACLVTDDDARHIEILLRGEEWDGDGLPPVGVNAEVFFSADTEPKWFSFLAKFIGENHVIALVGLEEISYKKDELLTSDVKFAPLRSEEDRKRDEITQSILDILNDYDFELVHIRSDQNRIATDIVERIASGMIPHTRID